MLMTLFVYFKVEMMLQSFINTLHPSINFDMEAENDGKQEFLDTLITRVPNSEAPNVSTKLRKQTRVYSSLFFLHSGAI